MGPLCGSLRISEFFHLIVFIGRLIGMILTVTRWCW